MKKSRREEEARILAEMEEALQANRQTEEQPLDSTEAKTLETLHCHKCGTVMENGKCPKCGHTVYVPMDAGMQKKIRWILTGVCLLILVVILIFSN